MFGQQARGLIAIAGAKLSPGAVGLIAIVSALAFGAVLAGLHALKDLV